MLRTVFRLRAMTGGVVHRSGSAYGSTFSGVEAMSSVRRVSGLSDRVMACEVAICRNPPQEIAVFAL